MEPEELGPLTKSAADTANGSKPPALIREWAARLESPEDVVMLWACAGKQLSWWSMDVCVGPPGDDPVLAVPATKLERLVGPFAHEGRVKILQALYQGPLTSSQLSESTGFQGGRLYHHLRELKYSAYVSDREGKYALTQLGRELLITLSLIAERAIEDRGEQGLAVGGLWDGQ